MGGIEYKNGVIEAVYHAEGRVIFNEASESVYEYNLKDHLGNVRAVISDRNNNGYLEPFSFDPTLPLPNEDEYSELLQENHYYPFGMEMEGAWELTTSTPENQYNYNGKEVQGDFGLDWLDYGARMYDASIGRWNAIDPLAELYYGYNSYHYVVDNPISNFDPNGMNSESTTEDLINSAWDQTSENGSARFDNSGNCECGCEGKPPCDDENKFDISLSEIFDSIMEFFLFRDNPKTANLSDRDRSELPNDGKKVRDPVPDAIAITAGGSVKFAGLVSKGTQLVWVKGYGWAIVFDQKGGLGSPELEAAVTLDISYSSIENPTLDDYLGEYSFVNVSRGIWKNVSISAGLFANSENFTEKIGTEWKGISVGLSISPKAMPFKGSVSTGFGKTTK